MASRATGRRGGLVRVLRSSSDESNYFLTKMEIETLCKKICVERATSSILVIGAFMTR